LILGGYARITGLINVVEVIESIALYSTLRFQIINQPDDRVGQSLLIDIHEHE